MKSKAGATREEIAADKLKQRVAGGSTGPVESRLGTDPDFLEAVLSYSADLVLIINEFADFKFASAASERIFGLWDDELRGRSLLEFVHPDDEALAVESLVTSVDRGRSLKDPVTLRVRHRSNRWHEIEVLATNLMDNPAVGGILINARDISGRSNGERRGSAAQRSFQQAFQRSPIGMAITTLDGNYARVNMALCELLGMSSEDLLQKSVLDTTHPEDLRATVDAAVSLIDGRTVSFSMEKRFMASGNRPIWARATTTLLRDENDMPLQFLTQVEDIEERRQVMEQLRISALRDPLTGLANRSGLGEYLDSLSAD
ncbi:MAG TPA: PAS domain S-box protein, partial [Microthrixaceae bacterium]|nr:PAS domain S-box protein [Microthrixaceae bacterium]